MATAIQRRRGTTTQHGSFTGLAGEITIDTTKNTIVVHDGSTAGGIPLATAAEVGALGGADITDVVAGAGLTGGASSGSATINVIGGDGITVSADAVAADQSYIRGSLSVTDAGGDGSLAYNNSTGVLTFTGPSASEVRAHISAGTGITVTDGVIATTITQYTEALSRGDISVTDAGGDGSLAYNSTTGVITYTGPSSSEVRAHITAGTGVAFSGGEISIGQAVATTSDVTFADLIVSGNLTVSGTQTSVNTETLTVDDNLIVLNNNESGTPSQDAGIEVERGTSTNVKLQFDEGDDKWQFTNDGSTYNDLLTVTQVEALFSVTDAGGDGSMAYNNTTGVFTYTGPSAAEARAHISASGDLAYNSSTGVVSFTERTDAEVRGLISAGGDLSYNSSTGVISFTNDAGDIEGVTAGSGITGGGTSGTVTVALDYENLTGNLIPSANNTYSLGSATNMWKDVYVGPGSLYVNGQKVIEDDSGTIQFSADNNQNISIVTAGTGDVEITSGGTIQLKSDVVLSAGKTISQSGGLVQASNINMDSNSINNLDDPVVAQDAATKAYVDTQVAAVPTGDITSVTAGTGLSGGGTTGGVSLALDLNELTAAAVDVTADSFAMIDGGDNSSKKESVADLVAAMAGTNLTASSGTLGIADAIITGKISVTDAGGLGSLAYNTGVITYTGPSNADITGLISVTDSGGDGSLTYSSGTITYTGPSASEVRAHFSAGTGIDISSGAISTDDSAIDIHALSGYVANEHIDHSGVTITAGAGLTGGGDITTTRTLNVVGGDGITANANDIAVDSTVVRTTGAQSIAGDKTFGNDIVISGNLTINGTQTTVSTETLAIEDNIIVLNNGTTGTPSENAGIQVDRGSSSDVYLNWDESNDKWQFTNDGSTYYNMLTESDVEGFFSATDAGGDGSFSYSNGVFTYTGPSASEVRAHFSGGTGIDISSGSITFDGSELSTSTTDGHGDHFVVVDDSNASRKLTKSSINISGFNNDSGFTTNVGDITGVTAGTGLSGGGASGGVTLNVSGLTVSELAADSLQTSGESFANNDTSLMTSAAVEDKILSYGYSTTVGDITGVTAGTGLSGGGASGSVTLNVSGLTTSELAAGSLQISSESFTDNDTSLMTSAAIQDKIEGYGYTTNVGDITGVTAGTHLSGGGSSGSVTLNVDTGAVSNGGTALATGDQIHDFVTGLGYSTTTGTVTSVAVTTAAGLDGATTITGSGTIALSLDLSELTDMTAAVVGSEDELILLDNGAERRKLISEITLSDFNNDAGFTTNVGDITGVTAGSYLTGGGSSGSVTLNVDATSANTASKVVARDGSGNFSAGTITATATQAQYADLAEKYTADADYEPGTVVIFGGDAEVTECDSDADHRVAGVVSTDPAYLMNSDSDGVAVALTGRVPCKVSGKVEKGALLVTSPIKGHAMQALQVEAGRIIGKAIEAHESHGEGVIEILVNMM